MSKLLNSHAHLNKVLKRLPYIFIILILLVGAIIFVASVRQQEYDWNNLSDVNGRKVYTDKKGNTALQGIDVSTYQGVIDWEAVKNDGIDFVMIRVAFRGYETGKLMTDDMFKKNISEANRVGIPTGVYVFSQALTKDEAIEEAELTLKLIQDFKVNYPVALDVEDVLSDEARTLNLTSVERTEIALAFLKTVKQAGYTPMIYSSKEFAECNLILNKLKPYSFWLAMYNEQPDFNHDFQMWQYSKKGQVAGIKGDVDLNLCFFNLF